MKGSRLPVSKTLLALRLALLTCSVCVRALHAQDVPPPPAPAAPPSVLPLYIEEFFLADAVRSEERGEYQVTFSGQSFRGNGSSLDGKAAGLELEYGITSRLQLGLELPYGVQSSATSELPVAWSTVSPSVQYQFIRSSRPFALSAALAADLPVNGRGEAAVEPELLVAKAFGALQIHANVTPEFSADEKSLEYNVAAVRPFAHDLFPTLEFNGRRIAGVNSRYVTPGLYRHFAHRVELGAGLPLGVGSHSATLGVVVKLTWEHGGQDRDDKDDK
jgi:hypothetical protein